MEGWRGGRGGGVEGWKGGGVEGWKGEEVEGVEGWQGGMVEGWTRTFFDLCFEAGTRHRSTQTNYGLLRSCQAACVVERPSRSGRHKAAQRVAICLTSSASCCPPQSGGMSSVFKGCPTIFDYAMPLPFTTFDL